MQSGPEAGFFNPRIFTAFLLVLAGVSLAVIGLAAPRGAPVTPASTFGPIVRTSVAHGTAPSVRDVENPLPRIRTKPERKLPRVKPAREVPADFVDEVLQSTALGPALYNAQGPLAVPGPIVNFEGMNQEEGCGGCLPPDTTGAVGPTQYVQMVNSAFSVYAKNGTRLSGPTAINQLFQSFPVGNVCRDTNNGDPIVVYDQLADRWLLSQFAFRTDANGNPIAPWDECVAVSQGPDATGPYYIYDFHLSDTKFHDYPHIALWPDAYYMMTHEFQSPNFNYAGAAAIAFERDKMLAGQPAKMVIFDLGTLPAPFNTTYGGHLPVNLDGFTLPPAGSPNYFVEVDTATESPAAPPNKVAAMRIWEFHVDWATPANSTFGLALQPNAVVQVADFARPPCSLLGNRAYVIGCVPQLGDPGQLDPIGDRLMYRAVYRNFGTHEALVLTHTVVANATPPEQMGPRWYEVRDPGGTPAIFQQSTFGPSGPTDPIHRFMASIAFDRAGNIAIGYSASSAAQFPSINYNGRLVGDPPNTLAQGETVMQPGGGPQHGEAFAPQTGRWGDYTTISVDPVDDCTFWYTNEYYGNPAGPTANWQTRVGSFKFAACTPRPVGNLTGTITESGSGNPILGAKVTAAGAVVNYTEFSTPSGVYQFSPLPPGTYTVTASAAGYFTGSATVSVTDGGVTVQDFALARNLAEPTPPPPIPPDPLRTVNPPALNDPGATITTNTYNLSWSPAEVTTNLAHYVVEESTNYVSPLFDNADGTTVPGDAGSPWTSAASSGALPGAWVKNTEYFHSPPSSYFTTGATDGHDTSLTLKTAITIPATVSSARLNFWSRFYNDPEDTGHIELSKDNGATWISLRILLDGPTVPPANTRMQNQEIDLNAYKGVPIKLRFRFNTDPVTYFLIRTLGWWVDDILVDGATWTQIATTNPNTTSLAVLNKPNGRYFYRVRAVYETGKFTANSNVQDIVVNAAGGSPTPTASPTATATASPTATATASPTATATATATASPTATATPGVTPTPTASATTTPSPTATASPTATVSPTVTPSATPTPTPAQLLNISTRARVQTGDNILIGGFIITGNTPKRVLLLGKGPSVSSAGTPLVGRLPDPFLELHDGNGALMTTNDNWKDSPERAEIENSGLAPSDDHESAIVRTLNPGNYTAVLRGVNNTTGIALVELYDRTPGSNSKLANISSRGLVGTGDNVLIGGFIAGNQSGNTTVLVRAIGPSLKNRLPNALDDPVLELHDSHGNTLQTNDNWKVNDQTQQSQQAAIEATGAPPSHDSESAMIQDVSPAGYTAIVRGKNDTIGLALVEIYNLK